MRLKSSKKPDPPSTLEMSTISTPPQDSRPGGVQGSSGAVVSKNRCANFPGEGSESAMRFQRVSVGYRRIAGLPPHNQCTRFGAEDCLQSFFHRMLRGLGGSLRSPWGTIKDIG